MRALEHLRDHLMADTALALRAENLQTFAEDGNIITFAPGESAWADGSAGPDNKDFQLQYDAVIYVLKSTVDARYLCFVVAEWMNRYQPRHGDGDLRFDEDIHSHTEVDFEFRLKLTEEIRVTETDDPPTTTLISCFGHGEVDPARGAMTPARHVFPAIISELPDAPDDAAP